MALTVGGTPVKSVYVGSTPVTAVYVGAKKVWPTGPRVVTIQTSGFEWIVGSQSGDVSMIQTFSGPRYLVFSVPVTCDQAISAGSAGTFAAGKRLEAGWVLNLVGFSNLLHTFTEII